MDAYVRAFRDHYKTTKIDAKPRGLEPQFIYHHRGDEFIITRISVVEDTFLAVQVLGSPKGYFLLPYFPEIEVRFVPSEGEDKRPTIGFDLPLTPGGS